MELNTIRSSEGSRKKSKRVGRGIGCGSGKTCGRGHKGQKSRTGGTVMTGFEGGQMPLHRRLPKVGFKSRKSTVSAEIRLNELEKIAGDIVTLDTLKAAQIIGVRVRFVKVFDSGEIGRSVQLQGVRATKGAKQKIEQAGGKVED